MATPKLDTIDTTPIQVFARATGKLHWLCPSCHYIHNATIINFRRPRVQCDGKWFGSGMCNKIYRLGLLFDKNDDPGALPPFNALLAPPLGVFSTNRLGRSALTGYTPAVAHVSGKLEYRCPVCDTWNRERIDFTGGVVCTCCGRSWRVSVLFHPPTPRTHRMHCPRDWSVTREDNLA